MQLTLSRTLTAAAATAAAALLAATPASAAAAMSVTPSSGLSDGQTVTVTGSGYTAGASVHVGECSTPDVCSNDTITTTAGADGTFSVSFTVEKVFQAEDWSTGTTVTVDCAAVQCSVAAWEEGAGTISEPISFS